MTIQQVSEILNAEVLTTADKLDTVVDSACGADLMSDVLAFSAGHALLLTGLINLQAIRTAEMMDMRAVVFVRGKKPTQDIIDLANDRDVILMTTKHNLYAACGLLYINGLH
ncbi:MAG: hypothetical protein LBS19_02910 [Clostridiales bacterium]|jgi:predicted transcriptional regulator|nr:hypothetical protein [Clostridiales bacterium]